MRWTWLVLTGRGLFQHLTYTQGAGNRASAAPAPHPAPRAQATRAARTAGRRTTRARASPAPACARRQHERRGPRVADRRVQRGGQREVHLPALHARGRPGHQPVHRRHRRPLRLRLEPAGGPAGAPPRRPPWPRDRVGDLYPTIYPSINPRGGGSVRRARTAAASCRARRAPARSARPAQIARHALLWKTPARACCTGS